MNRPSQLAGVAALAATALIVSACAPMTVHSFAARNARFAQYHTYRWADDGSRSTGDPRLDNNTFFETRIQTDADRQLASRGFEKVTAGSADLMLHYHASVTQQLDLSAADRQYGPCVDCRTASMYDAGTIMLDFVDTATNTLVWRGWVKASLDGAIDDQEWLEERIDAAIVRIVATVPGRM